MLRSTQKKPGWGGVVELSYIEQFALRQKSANSGDLKLGFALVLRHKTFDMTLCSSNGRALASSLPHDNFTTV